MRFSMRKRQPPLERLESRYQLSLTPFNGTPVNLPATIQAENFDNGGEGVAYHDNDAANQGGAYRQTGVDVEASG